MATIKQETTGNVRISVYLQEILHALRCEAQHWFTKNDTKTKDQIIKYLGAFELLLAFVEKSDFQAFVYTFGEQNISVQNIRLCFRKDKSRECQQIRNNVYNNFFVVCQIVVARLKLESIEEAAKEANINGKTALHYFEGEMHSASSAVESVDTTPEGMFQ